MSVTPPDDFSQSLSILSSTKKILGIDDDYEAYDLDIITHINSVFSDLTQLGVGPTEGYMIESKNDLWIDFLDVDLALNSVKTYVYLRVRLLFDPPTSGFAITAQQEQIAKLEWRLSVHRESLAWTPPVEPVSTCDIPGPVW